MSNELKIIIEAIKIQYFESDSSFFKTLFEESIDFKKLKKLAIYHSMSSVLYTQVKKQGIQNIPLELMDFLSNYSRNISMYNLAQLKETQDLVSSLEEEGILAIPYKGSLLNKELYNSDHLRESSDIDLLILPKDCLKAHDVFLKNGYTFDSENDSFENLLKSTDSQEFGFSKNKFHIDFHRAFNYPYLPYKLDYNSFFRDLKERTFFSKSLKLPNNSQLFSMIILHNGGKSMWLSLKHLLDFMLFNKKYGHEIDWENEKSIQQKNKTEKITSIAFSLANKYFGLNSVDAFQNSKITNKELNRIVNFWENANHYKSIWPRIKYERILVSSQDHGFNLYHYLKNFYKFKSFEKLNTDELESRQKRNFGINNFVYKLYNYLKR